MQNLGIGTLFLALGQKYTGTAFADAIQSLSGMEVEVVKHSELHTFKVIPKRWMVERTFAWLDHYRRLWKNCEV